MKTQFDIEKMIASGKIQNELDFERALIADRKLRVLAKENSKFYEKNYVIFSKSMRIQIGQKILNSMMKK